MLSNPRSSIEQDANLNPATLVADLRERARSARVLARGRGQQIDALYLSKAADEIERLQTALAEHHLLLVNAGGQVEQDVICEQMGIPVIDTLDPRPDPEFGHVFHWPPAVAQYWAGG